MKRIERSVSIHPYFRIHPGQADAVKGILREFVAKTATEEKCLWYEFTINGDQVFCREAYVGAEGALAHLENVGATLQRMGAVTTLERLEIHGPAEELEKLKAPLKDLKPAWFVFECGVQH